MPNFNIDVFIFIAFLAINLIVGLNYGRGVKTIKDYALGGRNFSTGTLVAAIVATWISGSGFFSILNKTYSDGLYFVIAVSGLAFSFLIAAYVFVPRMGNFLGSSSVAEGMGNLYGKEVRIITAIAGMIGAVGGIAVQFKAFSNIFDHFLGIPGYWAIIAAGGIVTIYSAFGGVRAVTFTDVLQFFTFGFAIPLIGFMIWNHNNDLGISFSVALQDPKFNFQEVLNIRNPKFLETIPLMLYFALPSMSAAFYQRIVISKNIEQAKKAFIISGFIILVIILAISWIPFLIYNINPNLKSNQLLGYIIDNYTYPGLKALMMIGVTAMAMSTADAYINASSVLFANDVCSPLKLGNSQSLLVSRIFSITIGILAVLLASYAKDLLDIVLIAHAFYSPIVVVPLMMSILGFRTTKKSVFISMAAGFITVVVWKTIGIKADCIAFAMLINLIFLVGSHYLLKQPGGWIKKQMVTEQEIKIEVPAIPRIEIYKAKIILLAKQFQNSNIIRLLKKYSPKSELTYMSFGVYGIFYTFTSMYSTQNQMINTGDQILLYIYQIMLCTSVCMAMYPIWPPRIKHEIIVQVLWNPIVFYMLIFFSGFLVLISNFYPLQFVVFTLNIIIVAMITSWRQAGLMMIPGLYASLKFYQYYAGFHDGLSVEFGPPVYILMYSLILIGAAFIVFFKPKEYEEALAHEKIEHMTSLMQHREEELGKALSLKNEFLRNISHEVRAPMVGITSLGPVLSQMYDQLKPEQVKKYIDDIAQNSTRLESLMYNILDLSALTSLSAKLDYRNINLSDLVNERAAVCRKLYLYDKDIDFTMYVQDDLFVSCDEYYIKQTIDNLIINAINYGKDSNITIILRNIQPMLLDEFAEVEFSVIDHGIGIPKEELYNIFGSFIVSSKTHTSAGGRGVGLALCKKVIDLHKGKIWAESDGSNGAIFSFTIPNMLT